MPANAMKGFRPSRVLRVVAVVAALALAIRGLGDWFNPFNDRMFAAAVWKESHPRIRAAMTQDLMEHHLPRGLTCEEVEELLGKPLDVMGAEGRNKNGDSTTETWRYDLWGWDIKDGFDSTFLYVPFSKERVTQEPYIGGY